MIIAIWTGVLVSCLALYLWKIYSRFSPYGVKQFKALPIVGNSGQVLIQKMNFPEYLTKLYNAFPGDRFVVIMSNYEGNYELIVGNYEFLKPVIVVKDLELIKQIAVKDYESFLDHSRIVDETVDPYFGRNLFSLRGQEWKDMRAALSPAFTSSKIRLMVPFMVEVCNQMIKSLKESIEASNDNYFDLECRDLLARFANDVIASCAFGLKVDSHNEKDNEFYEMGKLTTNISSKQIMIILAFTSFPKLLKKFKFSFFPPAAKDFFKNLVTNMINERKIKSIYRPDMIHLLMEAKKGKLTHDTQNSQDDDAGFATVDESGVGKRNADIVWSDQDLTAQALLFFFAGFDTVSTTMSFLLYEIAMNLDVQKRLVEEIKEYNLKNKGKFDYKAIQNMTYMDMVVSESLRKWPAAVALDRVCKRDYNLGKPHSKAPGDYILRQGEVINIPVWPIHRNAEHYPNPEKFNPERFSEENKHLIKPFTYMPFGLGPRNCIGSRFALCEVKVMLYHLLLHFELFPCEKTDTSEILKNSRISIRLKGGHWLRFCLR